MTTGIVDGTLCYKMYLDAKRKHDISTNQFRSLFHRKCFENSVNFPLLYQNSAKLAPCKDTIMDLVVTDKIFRLINNFDGINIFCYSVPKTFIPDSGTEEYLIGACSFSKNITAEKACKPSTHIKIDEICICNYNGNVPRIPIGSLTDIEREFVLKNLCFTKGYGGRYYISVKDLNRPSKPIFNLISQWISMNKINAECLFSEYLPMWTLLFKQHLLDWRKV